MVQPPDLLLLDGQAEAPHEGLEVLPHPAELLPVLAVEPFLRPVIFAHGEGGLQPEPVEAEAVEEPFVVAEEGRGVAGALRGEGDPLDVDDPAAGAAREGKETEHRLALPVEGEGEVAHRLVPADDIAVVEDPVLPEQEEAVAVGKAEDLGGQRVEEPLRRDAVREDVAPEREHAVVRRVPADEERRPFSALLDDRGVEFGAEEPVRRDQPVEPLEDVALRQGIAEPPTRVVSTAIVPPPLVVTPGGVASEGGAPFVARRAMNLHGCALPHFAPPPAATPPDPPGWYDNA